MINQRTIFDAAITAQIMASQNRIDLENITDNLISTNDVSYNIGSADKNWNELWINNINSNNDFIQLNEPIVYKRRIQTITSDINLNVVDSGSIFNITQTAQYIRIFLPPATSDAIGVVYKFILYADITDVIHIITGQESDLITGSVTGVHSIAFNGSTIDIDPRDLIIGDWFELVLLAENAWIITGVLN